MTDKEYRIKVARKNLYVCGCGKQHITKWWYSDSSLMKKKCRGCHKKGDFFYIVGGHEFI